MNPRPPRATLFPYTTLFRSAHRDAASRAFGNYALQALAKLGLGLRRAARERVEHQRAAAQAQARSEEHTSELQSRQYLVCRLLLEKKKEQPLGTACWRPARL